MASGVFFHTFHSLSVQKPTFRSSDLLNLEGGVRSMPKLRFSEAACMQMLSYALGSSEEPVAGVSQEQSAVYAPLLGKHVVN